MKGFKSRMSAYRWSGTLLTGVFTSYLGTYLFNLWLPNLPDWSKLLFYITFLVVFMIIIYLNRDYLKQVLHMYIQIGKLGYAANIRTIITKSVYESSSQFQQLKDDIDRYAEKSKAIDVLMINGGERNNDPLKDYLLDKVLERKRKNVNTSIILLSPASKYAIARAREFSRNPNEIDHFINEHRNYVNKMIDLFGNENIIFYDEVPIWRIFKLGNLMYVSRYVKGQRAIDSVTFGYLNPISTKHDSLTNPYDSFKRYIDYLKDKSILLQSPMANYILSKIHEDFNKGRNDSCNCAKCKHDIFNLFDNVLKEKKISFDELDVETKSEIYYKVSTQVFSNKSCVCYTNFSYAI